MTFSLAHELAEHVDGPDDDLDVEPVSPVDEAEVDRLLARLAHAEAERAQVNALADLRVAQIEAWRADRVGVAERRIDHLIARLTMWHQAILAADPSRKTISLPSGTLTARAQQPTWEFGPEFLEWACAELLGAVRQKPPTIHEPDVDVTAAKRLLTQERTDEKGRVVDVVYGVTADGQPAPGVTVTERAPKFSATTTKAVTA